MQCINRSIDVLGMLLKFCKWTFGSPVPKIRCSIAVCILYNCSQQIHLCTPSNHVKNLILWFTLHFGLQKPHWGSEITSRHLFRTSRHLNMYQSMKKFATCSKNLVILIYVNITVSDIKNIVTSIFLTDRFWHPLGTWNEFTPDAGPVLTTSC